MSEEHKQALIARCEKKIKQLSKVEVGIMHTDMLDLLIYCEAIAALTAKPDDWKQRAEAAEAKLAELEKKRLDAEVKLYRQESILPEGLSRCTAELVLDFAKAIAEKLHQSELKYSWSDGWKESEWQDKCLADFHHHIGKGDPRDVAAYCAFMWHHEWPTRPAPDADLVPEGWVLVPVEPTDDMVAAGTSVDGGVYCIWKDMLTAAPEAK